MSGAGSVGGFVFKALTFTLALAGFIMSSIVLIANDKHDFEHPVPWLPTDSGYYAFRVLTDGTVNWTTTQDALSVHIGTINMTGDLTVSGAITSGTGEHSIVYGGVTLATNTDPLYTASPGEEAMIPMASVTAEAGPSKSVTVSEAAFSLTTVVDGYYFISYSLRCVCNTTNVQWDTHVADAVTATVGPFAYGSHKSIAGERFTLSGQEMAHVASEVGLKISVTGTPDADQGDLVCDEGSFDLILLHKVVLG